MENAFDLSKAFGFLTEKEVRGLQGISKNLEQFSTVVNLGAGVGNSSLAVVEANNHLKVYTIDISAGSPFGGLENERNAFRNAGLSDKLPEQLLGDSIKMATDWFYGFISFLIIDDDHTYDHLKKEVLAWIPLVKSGGFVAFHDYGSKNWSDVKTVVDNLDHICPNFNFEQVFHEDTLIIFKVTVRDFSEETHANTPIPGSKLETEKPHRGRPKK